MSSPESSLTCSLNIEWTNNQGVKIRNLSNKTSNLRLIRNDSRQMFLEVNIAKIAPLKFLLKSINVHKKFMNEGKATIVFQDDKCTLYISNAPTGNLLSFLRTMFVKMTGEKAENSNTSLRTQLLSNKPTTFDEISPVTIAEINKAKQQLPRTTDTTPSPGSRKRKLNDKQERGPVAKKLYSSSPIPNEPLNIEQQQVLDACLAGHNVFFTGSAGTGKSYLLKKIIAALPPDVTIATASTGVAACHIGGITLHSFAGIGNGDATLERCYQLASKQPTAQIWRKCKHLIIDEISMVDGKFFGKIEAVARYVRSNDRPFGGIQLILCGDFFQLPPVVKQQDKSSNEKDLKFCFQSPAWNKCVQICYELKQVHRQTDSEFINILNQIRVGRVTAEITEKLNNTSKQKIEQDGILATRLCSQNADADIINESKLKSLSGESKTFIAQDSDQAYTRQLDQQTPVPGKLVLKPGAQVMLLRNVSVSGGLVNGARGIVTGFKNDLPVVKFRNNKEYAAKHEKWIIKTATGVLMTRTQVPLKLAWAFSIHKSQGLTLDCVEMSLSRVFEAGQAYVALSRAQSLETLRVLDFNQKQVWANPDVLRFYRMLREKIDRGALIPLGTKLSSLETKFFRDKKIPVKPKLTYGASKLIKSKPLMNIS